MQGTMVPVVLIPRFTTYAGEADYESAPVDVTAFDRLVVEYSCTPVTGGGTVTCEFQDSHDATTWFTLDSRTATGDVRVDLSRRWLRVVVRVGPSQGLTCWCSGQLRRRVE